MCRILIYKGSIINIKKLLLLPENSLIKQSFKKPYTPFQDFPNNRDHALNVDGIGIAWYKNLNHTPCIYKSTKPPWDDYNLINLCGYTDAYLLFSHIRGIKPFSKYSIVHDYNCHPFKYKNLLWMHNGDIENLLEIKKYVYSNVKDDYLNIIKGNTDSEYCFSIFLNFLKNSYSREMNSNNINLSSKILKDALYNTILKINEITNSKNSSMNFFCTDGNSIIASRYLNSDFEDPPSLYYSFGTEFKYNSNKKSFIKDALCNNNCIIISSEPIHEKEEDWFLIEKNVIISVDENNNIIYDKI